MNRILAIVIISLMQRLMNYYNNLIISSDKWLIGNFWMNFRKAFFLPQLLAQGFMSAFVRRVYLHLHNHESRWISGDFLLNFINYYLRIHSLHCVALTTFPDFCFIDKLLYSHFLTYIFSLQFLRSLWIFYTNFFCYWDNLIEISLKNTHFTVSSFPP